MVRIWPFVSDADKAVERIAVPKTPVVRPRTELAAARSEPSANGPRRFRPSPFRLPAPGPPAPPASGAAAAAAAAATSAGVLAALRQTAAVELRGRRFEDSRLTAAASDCGSQLNTDVSQEVSVRDHDSGFDLNLRFRSIQLRDHVLHNLHILRKVGEDQTICPRVDLHLPSLAQSRSDDLKKRALALTASPTRL